MEDIGGGEALRGAEQLPPGGACMVGEGRADLVEAPIRDAVLRLEGRMHRHRRRQRVVAGLPGGEGVVVGGNDDLSPEKKVSALPGLPGGPSDPVASVTRWPRVSSPGRGSGRPARSRRGGRRGGPCRSACRSRGDRSRTEGTGPRARARRLQACAAPRTCRRCRRRDARGEHAPQLVRPRVAGGDDHDVVAAENRPARFREAGQCNNADLIPFWSGAVRAGCDDCSGLCGARVG